MEHHHTTQVPRRITAMAKKSKKQEDAKAPVLTLDEAKEGKNKPDTQAPVEQAVAASPEHKKKTEAKLHWVPEGKDRTLCGIFHLDPRMTKADSQEEVTCAVCLKALSATGGKKRKKAERVTIQCADCGAEREIYAYQYGTVTRCETCQKRYRRRKTATKRRARVKARKAEKRLILKAAIGAHEEDAQILLEEYRGDEAMLRAVIECAKAMLKA